MCDNDNYRTYKWVEIVTVTGNFPVILSNYPVMQGLRRRLDQLRVLHILTR